MSYLFVAQPEKSRQGSHCRWVYPRKSFDEVHKSASCLIIVELPGLASCKLLPSQSKGTHLQPLHLPVSLVLALLIALTRELAHYELLLDFEQHGSPWTTCL